MEIKALTLDFSFVQRSKLLAKVVNKQIECTNFDLPHILLIFGPQELIFNEFTADKSAEVDQKQVLILIYEFRNLTGSQSLKLLVPLAHINMSNSFLGGNSLFTLTDSGFGPFALNRRVLVNRH